MSYLAVLGSRVRKKQIDCIMGPCDLQSTTWYFNKTRLRTWDHFPVVVKIDGKELRVKKGKKGWAGWIPKSEGEKLKFQELVLCPNGSRDWINDGGQGALETQQARLEGAAVKATATASRNKNKFKIPDEIREMAAAAQCRRDPLKKKVLRKKAQKSPKRI